MPLLIQQQIFIYKKNNSSYFKIDLHVFTKWHYLSYIVGQFQKVKLFYSVELKSCIFRYISILKLFNLPDKYLFDVRLNNFIETICNKKINFETNVVLVFRT